MTAAAGWEYNCSVIDIKHARTSPPTWRYVRARIHSQGDQCQGRFYLGKRWLSNGFLKGLIQSTRVATLSILRNAALEEICP